MLVAFDSTFLIYLLDGRYAEGDDKVTLDPRLAHLMSTFDKDKTKVVVPAPALSEVLIGAGEAAPRYLNIINMSTRLKVAPFAERAAVEAAAAHREAIKAGDKKQGLRDWQKVKYDHQIIAIAIVEGATIIYSNDRDIKKLALGTSIEVVSLSELPDPPALSPELPPVEPSRTLFD